MTTWTDAQLHSQLIMRQNLLPNPSLNRTSSEELPSLQGIAAVIGPLRSTMRLNPNIRQHSAKRA